MKKFLTLFALLAIVSTANAQVEAKSTEQVQVYFMDTDQNFVLDTVTEDKAMYDHAHKVGSYATTMFVPLSTKTTTPYSVEYKGRKYVVEGLNITEVK